MQKYLKIALLASLSLGLAPFVPEPHIWKQIMNLKLGRYMGTMDWVDLAMHGAPWLFLIIVLGAMLKEKLAKK